MMAKEVLLLKILEGIGRYKPIDYEHKRFELLAKHCQSPIERIFWSVAYFPLSKIGKITPQLSVGNYRVDFALTDIPDAHLVKAAIELDGHDYHKTKRQRKSDYERERYLQRQGWKLIRFTGGEVFRDPQRCVHETIEIVNEYIYWLGYKGRYDE